MLCKFALVPATSQAADNSFISGLKKTPSKQPLTSTACAHHYRLKKKSHSTVQPVYQRSFSECAEACRESDTVSLLLPGVQIRLDPG